MTETDVASIGPKTDIDPTIEARLARIGRVLRWVGMGYSLFVVVEVMLQESVLLRPAGSAAISLFGATGLASLAIGALLAGGSYRSVQSSAWSGRIGIVLCVIAIGFGVDVLIEAIGGPTLIGDPESLPTIGFAFGVFALGTSAILSAGRREWQVITGQILALVILGLAAVIVLGHFFGEAAITRIFGHRGISFRGSILTLIVSSGILLARPGSGLVSAASGPGTGSILLRRLGPAAILTPPVLLLLSQAVPFTARVEAIIALAVVLMVVFIIAFAVAVRAIDRSAVESASLAAVAERAEAGLEQEAPLVARLKNALHIVEVEEQAGWEVITRFRPAEGAVAGDASGVRANGGGMIGAVLVDVTGHGVDPALKAIRIRDRLMHSLLLGMTPGDALKDAGNARFGDELASAIAVSINGETGETLIAGAGHPPAIVVSAQDSKLLGPTGPLLYMADGAGYEDESVTLGEGDELVLFSDGIADIQRTRDGRTEPEFLADSLLSEGGDAVRSAHLVLGFGEDEPSDDQSVVVIRRLG